MAIGEVSYSKLMQYKDDKIKGDGICGTYSVHKIF
jgi:hypothetical protein